MTTDQARLAALERHLGWLLAAGVGASALLLVLGLLGLVLTPESAAPAHLLAAGLVILMATPMLRVVVSIAEYVRMREWYFVLTTLVVLIELAVGVIYAVRR